MEGCGGAEIHLQPWRTSHWNRYIPEVGCDSAGRVCWERIPCWSRFDGRNCTVMDTGVCSWRTACLGRDPHWSSLWRTATGGVRGGLLSCEEPHARAEEESEGSQRVWGGSGRDKVWRTDYSSHSLSPYAARREGGRENHEEIKPGKNKGVRGRGVKIPFYFSLPYSDFIDNKLISQSWVCFTLDGNWWVISPCHLYLHSWVFNFILSPLPSWGREWLHSFGRHLVSRQGQQVEQKKEASMWIVGFKSRQAAKMRLLKGNWPGFFL